ncbi:MarR family winged helix-turn-helix transcriptional regulator [Occultella gossypii]|uniref:MarR family transcriptional regulator n=1 Tax=Occultella gossypii TaxID=2800820 RepID=A0ABS7SDL4_9MICO|nr:MarR family transcriptional regulator [Occultella gossypii]MBZ2198245.1 MarR family transcriptional regulator [Occultella gossypii]
MDRDDGSAPRTSASGQRVAFLLSQVGGFAADRFAERVATLGVVPGDVGLLRLIATHPGVSQRALADLLGVGPSRVVALVDGLERKGLAQRTRSETDRRHHELSLTAAGRSVLTDMRELGAAHEADLLRGLTVAERHTLGSLLATIAASHDLPPDVHPGYRSAGRPDATSPTS